jgi:phosphoglycolate phosphatase
VSERNIRAILFDKDGTLIDFDATWKPVYWETARTLTRGDEALARRLLEVGGWDFANDSIRPRSPLRQGSNAEIAALWEKELERGGPVNGVAFQIDVLFRNGALRHVHPTSADLPGLFARYKRDGLRVGVASMDGEDAVRAMLERLGVDAFVDFVAGYDSGHGVKPEPGMAHAFARRCNIKPLEMAVVGDSVHDLAMGRAAGAGLVIGFVGGGGVRELLAPAADHVIERLEDLAGLIKTA